ncbi:MAG: hypothetical protein QXK63_01970, partial [Thermoproteus sp.]
LWVKSPRRIKLREPVSLATVYSILLNIADGGNIEQRPPLAESFGPLIAPSQKQFVDSIDRIKELYRYRSREPGRIYPN